MAYSYFRRGNSIYWSTDSDVVRTAHHRAEPMPGMINCYWVGPPPAPYKSVSEWYEQEGSKGILHGLYISPLPSRGGPEPKSINSRKQED